MKLLEPLILAQNKGYFGLSYSVYSYRVIYLSYEIALFHWQIGCNNFPEKLKTKKKYEIDVIVIRRSRLENYALVPTWIPILILTLKTWYLCYIRPDWWAGPVIACDWVTLNHNPVNQEISGHAATAQTLSKVMSAQVNNRVIGLYAQCMNELKVGGW